MTQNCRTCGKVIYSSTAKNLFQETDNVMLHKIEVLTGLFLLQLNEFPAHICGPCEIALREAIRFRELVILTQKTLQCSENMQEVIEMNETGAEEEQPLSEDNQEEEEPIGLVYEEMEIPTEDRMGTLEEFISIQKFNKKEVEPQHTKAKLVKPTSVYASLNFADQRTTPVPRINWDLLTEEEVVALKRERRKRDCICEQCGRHFSCPSNLKVHLLRHTGIKNYKCPQCSQQFYTAHLLRRHERMHTSDKPYPCHYCDKAFTNTSGRLQHERTRHTHVKPFKCTECDKSFVIGGKLKTHMLSHTGVRSFHCGPCKVSFLRRSHLVVHNRSKGHIQNMNTQALFNKVLDIDVETVT